MSLPIIFADHLIYSIILRLCCLCWAVALLGSDTVRACPVLRQGPELDTASKAHLAPLVFQGRLLELQVQLPVIRGTFRIQKLYKKGKMAFLKEKMDVVVEYYSVSPGGKATKRGPQCRGAFMDPNVLKVTKNYFVFAGAVRRRRDRNRSQNLIGVSEPEFYTKKRFLYIPKVLCNNCTKAPTVKVTEDVEIELKSRLRLECESSGKPQPRIQWFKDGVKIKSSERIRVRSRKRSSRLVIRKAIRSDAGQYVCKSSNAFGESSGVIKVFITLGDKRPKDPVPANDSTPPLWPPQMPQGLECPIKLYCLNGGTCFFFESLGEYGCECSDGYRGQRCENKAISMFSSPAPLDAPQSPHDLDATTRMLQHYWGK